MGISLRLDELEVNRRRPRNGRTERAKPRRDISASNTLDVHNGNASPSPFLCELSARVFPEIFCVSYIFLFFLGTKHHECWAFLGYTLGGRYLVMIAVASHIRSWLAVDFMQALWSKHSHIHVWSSHKTQRQTRNIKSKTHPEQLLDVQKPPRSKGCTGRAW